MGIIIEQTPEQAIAAVSPYGWIGANCIRRRIGMGAGANCIRPRIGMGVGANSAVPIGAGLVQSNRDGPKKPLYYRT